MSGRQFLGHWKSEDSENMDEFMKAAGINFLFRQIANNITSYEEWGTDGDKWSVHIRSTFKSKKLTFNLGDEFDDETFDGRKIKLSFRLEGDKLIHRERATKEGELNAVITREILPDGRMLAIFYAENKGDVTGKKYYVPYRP